MELEQEFLQLSTKFLFLNCGSQLTDYRNEINTLLNELNGLNYRVARINDGKAPVRLVESFANIPPQEDTLVVKACFLIKALVSRQKILLPEKTVQSVLDWLKKCLDQCFHQVAYEVLTTVPFLFRQFENITQFYDFFISNNGILISIIADPNYRKVERKQQPSLDHCNPCDLYSAAVLSIESILVCSEKVAEEIEPYLPLVGNAVLDLLFNVRSESYIESTFYGLVTSALNCLRIVVELDTTSDWTNAQLGRLIGTGKAFMMYGIPEVAKLQPQRIPVSQQGIPEPQHIPMSKGGRVAKKRKTRAHPRGKKGSTATTREGSASGTTQERPVLQHAQANRLPYSESSIVLDWISPVKSTTEGHQTSDSDYSESEATSSREQIVRHRVAKLRQSALMLIGMLAQHVEKRVMFGYWHALFPDETRTPSTVSLLNCVLRDPSPKCRIAAIQTTSFMLHKSKPFLIQAENSKKTHVSFTPFSVTLGNMIVEMYAMLTRALATESDLTVLTQLLKGLTICIQATPFHRLRTGIATQFVQIVRPLVTHRDPTVKVGALMVMGFLISVPNITEEIASLVGIRRIELAPTGGKEARSKPIMKALNLQANQDEEEEEEVYDEPETEHQDNGNADDPLTSETNEQHGDGTSAAHSMSWLTQVALENLGVNGVVCPVVTVRMECLQVLCVMTGHYSLLCDHLLLVARALVNAFGDPAAEIKLYAGRVLDLLGHAIHTSLLSRDTIDPEELNMALEFWLTMVPVVTGQIQEAQLVPSVRSVCCDALGNIGVNVFEKLPRCRHLALISLLTGCTFDEDSAVSSAAARALAVYILFPSLRDDVCYVENTIESILRLLKDPNLTARIKTSWSLGNVTDALVLNVQNAECRVKINNDLLRRILETAMESAKDNDKVRSNGVRTIGNVLHLLRSQQLEQPMWITLWQEAIERLVQNVANASGVTVKVKWNACYALGSMMKNEASFSTPAGTTGKWQRCVFPALCDAMVHSPNFKVRINAAQALSIVPKRSHYGVTFFHSIWTALLQALEQSDNLVDYLEYKRRDTLQEQLCLSVAHFLRLAAREDIASMAAVLLPLYDVVRRNWVRVVNRILPEKSVALMESYHLLVKLREGRANVPDSVPESSWNLLVGCFECVDHETLEK